MKKLITKGASNVKLAKAPKAFRLSGLFLAPHDLAGHGTVCPAASRHCIKLCLHKSGMARVHPVVTQGRIRRTELLHDNPEEFKRQHHAELASELRCAERDGQKAAHRCNGTSDLDWTETIKAFPDIQFYDYTKVTERMFQYLNGQLPKNYWLTFSRSEVNEAIALRVLRRGGNIAVVVDTKVQVKFNRQVINGDIHDLRFLDGRYKHGKIVVLKAKGEAKGQGSNKGFVLDQAGWDRFLELALQQKQYLKAA